MNIGEYSVTNKVTTWLLVILAFAGGLTALQDISRLEDPEFTIKDAKIYTFYPGATPKEVEREVTYHIENAIQELSQLWRVESISQAGFSEVTVKIKKKFKKHQFPQIWDEVRRKVNDVQKNLPPGAKTSIVHDDFGDVFGLFYALTGEGYSYRELKDFADFLKEVVALPFGETLNETVGALFDYFEVDVPNVEAAIGEDHEDHDRHDTEFANESIEPGHSAPLLQSEAKSGVAFPQWKVQPLNAALHWTR